MKLKIFKSTLVLLLASSSAFSPDSRPRALSLVTTAAAASYAAPSDYDIDDLEPNKKEVSVTYDDNDEEIRDALKRELLLLSSVTNRGEYASSEERDIVIDIVTQLEALNPTVDPASNCVGEWDLCLSSTQFFRSSPFFQTIRVAVNNRDMAENGFDIHDRATSASRVGRVRQVITDTELISEVELEVGMMPGFPLMMGGTVVTKASLKICGPELWETQILNTEVKGSNLPIFNQLMDDMQLSLPVGDVYNNILGDVPVVPMKTFYVDEGIRITRDVDDNFFVFSRA